MFDHNNGKVISNEVTLIRMENYKNKKKLLKMIYIKILYKLNKLCTKTLNTSHTQTASFTAVLTSIN